MSRILLVDDDEMLRSLLRETLQLGGHTVLEAENGAQAMQLSKVQEWDIVVTDIIMPDKEGFETISEFRDKFPGRPIIAMSGGGRIGAMDYLTIAQQLGASQTLEKPFPIKKLLEAVEAVCGTST